MLTCRETSSAIASDELSTAGRRRRWQVKLHLLMCRNCRAYAAQIKALGRAARDLLARPGRRLNQPELEALERVELEIFKHLGDAKRSAPNEDDDDPV